MTVCALYEYHQSGHTRGYWYLKDLYLSRVFIQKTQSPGRHFVIDGKYLQRVTITVDSDKDTDGGRHQITLAPSIRAPKYNAPKKLNRLSSLLTCFHLIFKYLSRAVLLGFSQRHIIFLPRHPDWPVMASSILTTCPPVLTDGLRVSNMEISWSPHPSPECPAITRS